MIAASGFLASSECTNFVFGRGGALGELVEGGLLLRGRVYRGEREGGNGRRREENRKGRDQPPLRKFLDSPCMLHA